MLPGDISEDMEGCPESNTLLYLILSSLLIPTVFVLYKLVASMYSKSKNDKKKSSQLESMKSMAYANLQMELFGERRESMEESETRFDRRLGMRRW